MASLHEHSIPWHLLGAAFLGQLTPAEEQELQAWLAQDPAHQDVFDRLKNTWENDLDDYALYLRADENVAWQKFRNQLPVEEERPRGAIRPMRRWIAAAAVVLLAGAGWWLLTQGNKGTVYQTAQHEHKTVPLPDGSSIVLEPLTQVKVAADYNKKDRSVDLAYGEATFDVIHDANIPFSVKLGDAAVNDLGTSFVIRRKEDSIVVKVTSGKVAFVNGKGDESARLSAGMVLHFSTKDNNTGKIISIDSTAAGASLRFVSTPLPQVLTVLQQHFGKQIVMEDTGLATLKFTADAQGQAFELVLDVLCRSLNLQYRQEGGIYYLRQKK